MVFASGGSTGAVIVVVSVSPGSGGETALFFLQEPVLINKQIAGMENNVSRGLIMLYN